MSRVQTIDIDVANESTTGFATGLTGAGPFSTFTTNVPTDNLAHQLSLTSAANLSAITLTVAGLDADGKTQTEAITGPNATTVESTSYWSRINTITASATLGANTMDVGWVDEVCSRTVPLDRHRSSSPGLMVDVTGTINYTVQQTMQPFQADGTAISQSTAWVNAASPLAGATADQVGTLTRGATALRIITSSYSSGAELQLYVSEAGPGT
jgi:hypothetical protein